MQEESGFGAARQQSASPINSPRCSMCCIGGGRRGKRLTELEFDGVFRDCRAFFSNSHRPQTESRGNIASNEYSNSKLADADSNIINDIEDEYYKAPSRWQVFCRKMKAEARRNMRRHSAGSRFHYDSLSYAMNFDDNSALMQPDQDEAGFEQIRLHSARFSGPVHQSVAEVLPITA